jgi:hypothetical protein
MSRATLRAAALQASLCTLSQRGRTSACFLAQCVAMPAVGLLVSSIFVRTHKNRSTRVQHDTFSCKPSKQLGLQSGAIHAFPGIFLRTTCRNFHCPQAR